MLDRLREKIEDICIYVYVYLVFMYIDKVFFFGCVIYIYYKKKFIENLEKIKVIFYFIF